MVTLEIRRHAERARDGDPGSLTAAGTAMAVALQRSAEPFDLLRSGWGTVRLHDLFVRLADRRRGAGRRLFESARAWASARGVRWMEWQASSDGLGFYERLGLRGEACPDPDHPFFEIDFQGR